MATEEIKVPDIGDFDNVPVIEVLVKAGDSVEKEQSLITLESEKATMEVPAPKAGTIREMKVTEGDKVATGSVIALMEPAGEEAGEDAEAAAASGEPENSTGGEERDEPSPGESRESGREAPRGTPASGREPDLEAEVVVLGSGPGGYTAAFRAADLGCRVVLVERYPTLGGVCLNVGCIPSKALLHAAKVIDDANEMRAHGVDFGKPKIDSEKLHAWQQSVVKKLTGGLASMAKKRDVTVVQGKGRFSSSNEMTVTGSDGEKLIRFDKAIIAAGSDAVRLKFLPWDDRRVMDSTRALDLEEIPERLLVIGGGIIGLEMACVYEGLGSKVSVVELMDQLMPGADKDLVKPLADRIGKRYANIWLETEVTGVEAKDHGLEVSFKGKNAPDKETFDRVLVAVGRSPNGAKIGAEHAGVEVDERGFIPVDRQQRTSAGHIFAIGDLTRGPMLAHKATHEGKAAAEVAAGEKSGFDARVIPSVAYTDPEVAWVGVTETEAKEKKLNFGKGTFPWAASGRALGLGRSEGFTKLLFDKETNRIIGAGIVGPNAGDLISEVGLAIEMGAEAADIGMTVHPHPTLSETVAFAAEAFEGTITDLYIPKKK